MVKEDSREPVSNALEDYELTSRQIEVVLDDCLTPSGDYADIYFESRSSDSVSMEERLVKKASRTITRGAGVRVLSGEKTGYAHSDEISFDTLKFVSKGKSPISEGRKPDRLLFFK